MFRISNCLVGLLNFIILLLGLATVATYLYLEIQGGGTGCQKALQLPLLVTGVVLVVFSLLGMIGACCRSNVMLVTYLLVMFLLIFVFFFAIFWGFLVTNNTVGKFLSIGGSDHLDFKNWLRMHVVNDERWADIKTCIKETPVCTRKGGDAKSLQTLLTTMNYIQEGCCRPPSECGFVSANATVWNVPKNGVVSNEDKDCKVWNNNQDKLCFDCESCKKGVVKNIKKGWKHLLLFNIVAFLVILMTYICGCCARRNNKYDNLKKRHAGPPRP